MNDTRRRIFVFGSNLLGLHGAGSAEAAAKYHGAERGVGFGPTGRAYAIPTKDRQIMTMSIDAIRPHVEQFVAYATSHPDLVFDVVKIGCGLAGYTEAEMAPLFRGCPDNVVLPPGWRDRIAADDDAPCVTYSDVAALLNHHQGANAWSVEQAEIWCTHQRVSAAEAVRLVRESDGNLVKADRIRRTEEWWRDHAQL